MGNAISYRNISMVFQVGKAQIHALENVSFDVDDGEFVSIVGPSGCGKTTLLRLTLGLLPLTSGEIVLNGKRVEETQTDVGVVFQSPVLLPWKNTIDNILFQMQMRNLNVDDYRKKAEDLIKLAGLHGFEDRYPSQLSGGMQQRVSICRAMIHDPSILLMDEPFGALDAMTRDVMNIELSKIWEEKRKTVLFVTHSISEAIFLSDRVMVMTSRPGRMAADIPIELSRPRNIDVKETAKFVQYIKIIRENLGEISSWSLSLRGIQPQ